MSSPQELNGKQYEKELLRLQTELVYMQEWIVTQRRRLVVLFEGRDTAGKDGAMKRITAYLNPRTARIVALPAPDSASARSGTSSATWPSATGRRDRAVQSQLVQPRGRRARDGLLQTRGDEEFLRVCPEFEHPFRTKGSCS